MALAAAEPDDLTRPSESTRVDAAHRRTRVRRSSGSLELARRRSKVVAIGELGLDYYRDLSPRDRSADRRSSAQLRQQRRAGKPDPATTAGRRTRYLLDLLLPGDVAAGGGILLLRPGDLAVARRGLDLGLSSRSPGR